jgi:hypothetical protein
MSKAFVVWLLFVATLCAIPDGYFAKEEQFVLKKDQFAVYEIDGKPLTFRWTLFINRGLVMHYAYDGFPHQNVLYREYKKDSFQIRLKQQPDDHMEPPYLMVQFVGMEEKEGLARFSVYVFDPLGSIRVNRK